MRFQYMILQGCTAIAIDGDELLQLMEMRFQYMILQGCTATAIDGDELLQLMEMRFVNSSI